MPKHPDASESGLVAYPDIDTLAEMENMIDAQKQYELDRTACSAL
jgi:flagellar basal body rod protein FlgC